MECATYEVAAAWKSFGSIPKRTLRGSHGRAHEASCPVDGDQRVARAVKCDFFGVII